ncbi:MAG: hypothetical protein ACRC28_07960 [Clostridium sp.]|uniref:hypothetical protein n=1 Tax=Clostridium sp. TaxID=1506 RepID=UPI003F31D84B
MNPSNETLKNANSSESKNAKEFRSGHREVFSIDDSVYIQASTLESQNKLNNKYERIGIVKKVLENDSYIVEHNGKSFKRSHSQLKLLSEE